MSSREPDTDPDFPLALTEEEQAAGFFLGEVQNPKGHYGAIFGPGPSPTIRAVVRECKQNDLWSVKMVNPASGGVTYATWKQRGGVISKGAAAEPAYTVAMVVASYPWSS